MDPVGARNGIGCHYGVGVGPGDPELLKLKALQILREVPLICVPQAEIRVGSYALNIISQYIDRDTQEVLRLIFPTNNEKAAGDIWREAAEVLAKRLKDGRDAAFIIEDDPMLYSTFAYILQDITLAHPEIPVEIVPGVSSVMAAAASAAIPLVTHGQRLAILPAVYGIDDLREAIANYDTIVLMKVNRTLLSALANLETLGLAGKGIYVRRASTPGERVINDLRQLTDEDLDYFSLLIIRK